jgi:PBP1b-binding outer membrane lipoprotein LpoB
VNDCLSSPRIIQAINALGRVPRIIVEPFKNESSEHINTAEVARSMEIALDNSGRFATVAAGEEREAIRSEQTDQLGHASEDTAAQIGNELGAEFRLSGTVSANVDKAGNRTSRAYTITVYLTDITTAQRLWSGSDDSIRKTIVTPKTKF